MKCVVKLAKKHWHVHDLNRKCVINQMKNTLNMEGAQDTKSKRCIALPKQVFVTLSNPDKQVQA